MKFMMIVKSAERFGHPPKELMEAIDKLSEEANRAGSMIGGGGLGPTALGARVRLSNGKVTVTDGLGRRNRGSPDVRTRRLRRLQTIGSLTPQTAATRQCIRRTGAVRLRERFEDGVMGSHDVYAHPSRHRRRLAH